MVDNGAFTWGLPFWQQSLWRWDAMFAAGVRAHYVASCLAARRMIEQRSGLIVNISFGAAKKRIGNVAYGVAKAATDKMTADMAEELRSHGVAVVSLYPGSVRTEEGDGGGSVSGPEQLGIAAAHWSHDSRTFVRPGGDVNKRHGCGGGGVREGARGSRHRREEPGTVDDREGIGDRSGPPPN
jgi:NAD(P)-dependent dehydrogenase (short-subunit alcohol dehydrogenase family)